MSASFRPFFAHGISYRHTDSSLLKFAFVAIHLLLTTGLLTPKSLIDKQGRLLRRITLKQACSFIRDFRVQRIKSKGWISSRLNRRNDSWLYWAWWVRSTCGQELNSDCLLSFWPLWMSKQGDVIDQLGRVVKLFTHPQKPFVFLFFPIICLASWDIAKQAFSIYLVTYLQYATLEASPWILTITRNIKANISTLDQSICTLISNLSGRPVIF